MSDLFDVLGISEVILADTATTNHLGEHVDIARSWKFVHDQGSIAPDESGHPDQVHGLHDNGGGYELPHFRGCPPVPPPF